MVSYLNIVSGMEKKNKNDNHNNNHNNKRRLSSNSQLAPICSICKSNNNQIITDSARNATVADNHPDRTEIKNCCRLVVRMKMK